MAGCLRENEHGFYSYYQPLTATPFSYVTGQWCIKL